MDKKQTAIVLGGTTPHIELIKKLKNRGYYTLLVDYYENPPAKAFADEHIRESTLEQECVLRIAKEKNAKLAIATCVDQANVTACYIAEKLNLPKLYSYETAKKVTDKAIMKYEMTRNEIPTTKYVIVEKDNVKGISGFRYPVVVKPADSTGSKGVKKANNELELKEYLDDAFKISRNKKAIVEEYKKGIEIQADFFVQNSKTTPIMIRRKRCLSSGGSQNLQSCGSIVPADISDQAKHHIIEIAEKIVGVFHLENTALFLQAIVSGNDVSVIEFGSRIGGGLSFSMINAITGFDILEATINAHLGNETELKIELPNYMYMTNIIYAQKAIYGYVAGQNELLKEKVIEKFYTFKTHGMEIYSDLSSRNRIAAFLIKGTSKIELYDKLETAMTRLEVFDTHDKIIMRKDLKEIEC